MLDPLAPLPSNVLPKPRPSPTQVAISQRVDAISVGTTHACARTESGALLCWGMDVLEAYGDACGPARAPVTVFAAGVESIYAGHFFTCAVVDGVRQCVGAVPSSVLLEDGSADHSAMGGGVMTSCGLVSGRVLCEGSTAGGLTAKTPGDPVPIGHPVAIEGIADAQSLSLGTYHGCARIDGQAWCWGNNDLGQTARPREATGFGPTRVGLSGRVIDLQCGSQHACALVEDETVQCWGHNASYQVGPGPRSEPRLPTTVSRTVAQAIPG